MRSPTSPPPADLAPPRAEAWLSARRGRVTAALLGAAVFVRLILCLQIAGGPLPRVQDVAAGSDNHFFDVWGRRVAGGDLLQRAPFHPMPGWMRIVADRAVQDAPGLPDRLGVPEAARSDRTALEEALWDRWLGGATFFQEPGYPYLVGLTYALTGPAAWHVFAWQLALGIALVLVVHALARRLFSETAALAAGVLAVLAPIPLAYEVTLLRDGLVAFVTVALALLMHWTVVGGRRRWLVLGVAFGAAALVKQSFLAFPVAMAVFRLVAVRSPLRARLAAAGLAAAGIVAALLPAIARNLAVGVPPLALNGSAAAMLALNHTAESTPLDVVIGPMYVRALAASDGRFLASLAEAARTHASAWGFVRLNLEKLLYAWHGFESPNNVDFYLFRQAAPVLAALPVGIVVLTPLAAIGVASRRAADAWPALVAVLASLPTLVLVVVLSRYRAALVAALLPLAGAGLVRLGGWIAARRLVPVGVAAAATSLYLAWALSSPPGKDPATRARSYAQMGGGVADPAFAALYFAEAMRLAPTPTLEARLGQALLASGDPAAALPHLEAARLAGDSAPLRELHAAALRALGRAAPLAPSAEAPR